MSSLFAILLCFRISQCQDLETEIAGLAEVGIGTETEMAAADSGAAAGSVVGAGLEVSVYCIILVFYRRKLHSRFSGGGSLKGKQPGGNLRAVNWDRVRLEPFEKNFYNATRESQNADPRVVEKFR